jgi:antitoxin PrlF
VAELRQLAQSEETDPDQAWFWTPQWQAKEREADAAIAAGDGEFFDSSEAFLASLDEN